MEILIYNSFKFNICIFDC